MSSSVWELLGRMQYSLRLPNVDGQLSLAVLTHSREDVTSNGPLTQVVVALQPQRGRL